MQTNNKLRETLEIVAKQLTDATEDENFGEDVMYLVGCMRTMSQKCRAALAEPVKNCEVGTAKEQAERWYWRYHVGHLCQSCPLGPRKWSEVDAGTLCFSEWLQMPYKKGVAK